MIWFWIWLAGLVTVQVAGRWSLRSEPTAHGHIVGGCAINVVSLIWPLALIYAAAVLSWIGINWLLGRDG